jgi:hypothetical protein
MTDLETIGHVVSRLLGNPDRDPEKRDGYILIVYRHVADGSTVQYVSNVAKRQVRSVLKETVELDAAFLDEAT